MVRESISKMKKQKAAGPLCVVSEMVKTAGEREVGMVTVLVNQIIGRVIPPEWDLSVIVNCFKGKDNSSERENCTGLELTDNTLKITRELLRC